MTFSRAALVAVVLALASYAVPFVSSADTAPYSEVVITTRLAAGVSTPIVSPIVTVTATVPTMYGATNNGSSQLYYQSNFANDTRYVTFVPGSYNVSITDSNYYFTYSPDCSGFTPLGGAIKTCTVTLSTTPQLSNPCTGIWYGTAGCPAPIVAYAGGSYVPTHLSCTPNYQSIGAGQAATFTATGGTPGGYNWSTADRTFLNVGAQLTTVFQTMGTQTVNVSNGVQNATCTVAINSTGGAITYSGSSNASATTYSGAASVVQNYVPAYLPNTGFGPQNGTVFALIAVLLMSAGVFFFPYVRKALAIIG
ncbi:MAG: hypothetical protein NT019_02315 [Candidatus Adlerbacteria bacterium]|nr:hypothetical protein [Candidatus Adlerbacteria bacterium]